LNLRHRVKEEPTIDLTSLIDVVFLLLIFFMVSTTFEQQATLKVDLPEASSSEKPVENVERLELVIDPQGRIYVNDQKLVDERPQTLIAAITQQVGTNRDLPIILRADRETPHHYVVMTMDVAAQLGFRNLSIATDRVDGSTE
jgi:biopolymer transport protein ExbD